MAPLGERDGGIAIGSAVVAASDRLAAGDAEQALALLSPLVSAAEPPVAARFVLALTAWKMGRLDWALELARACHEAAPMAGAVAETLASLYAQSGDLVESVYFGKLATALGSADELATLVPKDFPSFDRAFLAIRESPLLAKAQAELAAGKLADALESARQHVALNDDDAEGRAFHAALLHRAGRPCDAVAELRRVEREAQDSAPLAALYAQSLASAGDAAAACRWHEIAATLAPDDPGIAAMRIADGIWLDDGSRLAARGAQWARRHAASAKPHAWSVPDGPLVIAYIVPALRDGRDAAAIAAVARAHALHGAKTLAYAHGAQSWIENAALCGAFGVWQDIGRLDPATIARYFRHDGVHVAIDAAGFASPSTLMALARTTTALRVSWLGNPAALGAPIYDLRIVAGPQGQRQGEWGIAGGYPIPAAERLLPQSARASLQFGSDASLAQLDDSTVSCWTSILHAMPDARLLLRAHDGGAGTVNRLVARFGREIAARVDLVAATRFEEFYPLVDVALAPRRGASPRMAAEAVACSVPVVAFAGTCAAEPYGPFLAAIGAGAIGANEGGYVRRALTLARERSPFAVPQSMCDAACFAAAIEEHAVRALRQAPCP